ncbi:hypothetical protein ACFQ07_24360 [Actinomadura adrarensis]|uniref:Uncharacterized protein n=1 Tax=Actinomadura adrarensis TaxID=1819600 RepID=A0ABW3CNN5_9ACTN
MTNLGQEIAEAARAQSGPSGLSAYVARQLERDNPHELELIAVAEAEHATASARSGCSTAVVAANTGAAELRRASSH